MINSKTLIHWYLDNKRELPWRNTQNPYHIWLSEIILQQTRVDQGLPYYLAFTSEFPTIQELAFASEEQVLKLWQGLGYYSRARNLHSTAKFIVNQLGGIFPNTFRELLKLKGVGDYTASAIASICYNEVTPVLDGNVYRVLARYYGIKTPINTSKAREEFKRVLQDIIDKKDPATFNQAIMEFGAKQCKPKSPNCSVCPFEKKCYANAYNMVGEFPVKLKPKKVKKRHFNYLVFISQKNKTQIEKRSKKGIWQNLYQFPLIESDKSQNLETIETIINQMFKEKDILKIDEYNEQDIIHKLSHQHLYTKFWIVRIKNLENGVSINQLKDYPFPVLISNFLQEFSY